MADLREIEIPEVLSMFPDIQECYDLTDKYISDFLDDVDDVHADIFISSATEYGIERREKILGITPPADATLEERRMNVLIQWTAPLINQPLSKNWVVQKIKSFFDEGKCNVRIDYDTGGVAISIHDGDIKKAQLVVDFLDKYLPVNLWYKVDESVYLLALYEIGRCGTTPYNANVGISSGSQINVKSDNSSTAYNLSRESEKCGIGAVSGLQTVSSIDCKGIIMTDGYSVSRTSEKCGAGVNTGITIAKGASVACEATSSVFDIGRCKKDYSTL